MAALFGFGLHDIEAMEQPFSLGKQGDQGGELWRLHLALQGAEVLRRDGTGKPVATRHRFGKGIAYYYATALSLGYFRRPQAEVRRWIVSPAVERNTVLPVEMKDGPERIVFRGMVAPSQRIAILGNWGPKCTSTVCFQGDFRRVVETVTGSELKPRREQGRTTVEVNLENGSVAVVVAE